MFINRDLESKILYLSHHFPVVAIMGPRQSGKTTLAQHLFKEHNYVSFEDLDERAHAHSDPRGFLAKNDKQAGIILDEIQHAPHLLSYLQTIVDREKKMGRYIITGSQNLMIGQAISQSLAGRMAIATLLPLSIHELTQANILSVNWEDIVFRGGYPRAYKEGLDTNTLYRNYLQQYVERDVRQIKNIEKLDLFQNFLQLCAGRIGQPVNLTALGNDCGIDQGTVKSWLTVLQESYIIIQLQPFYKNFGKRLTKATKLYFTDTGLACALLKIRSPEALREHYLRGGLFESFIVSDLFKQYYNDDQRPSIYFWRNQTGNEIDCIIDEPPQPVAVEIKSSATFSSSFLVGINYWQETTEFNRVQNYVIYGGDADRQLHNTRILSWKTAGTLIPQIIHSHKIV